MRSPKKNALPIKALSLLAAKYGVCLGRGRFLDLLGYGSVSPKGTHYK